MEKYLNLKVLSFIILSILLGVGAFILKGSFPFLYSIAVIVIFFVNRKNFINKN